MKKRNYKPEPLLPGHFYHIYNRGNNSIDIFFDSLSYEHFLRLYRRYIDPIAETYAWCLLKNHFHLLIYVRKEDEILKGDLEYSTVESPKKLSASHQFSHFFNAYTQAINKKFKRTGSLFEKPFARKKISSPEYFKNLIYYIHNNPVQHGFVSKMELYPWSSYEKIVSERPTRLNREEVLRIYGNKEHYVSYHKEARLLGDIEQFIIE